MSGKTPPIRRKLVILRIPPIRPSADPPSADPFLCKILMRRAICRPKLPSTEPQELRRSESELSHAKLTFAVRFPLHRGPFHVGSCEQRSSFPLDRLTPQSTSACRCKPCFWSCKDIRA